MSESVYVASVIMIDAAFSNSRDLTFDGEVSVRNDRKREALVAVAMVLE